MFKNALFFVYILASFAGLLAIIFAGLLIRYWKSGNRKLLGALLGFEVCTVVIASMYFLYYFTNISNDTYCAPALIRILDIWMYLGQTIMWAIYVSEKSRVTVLKSKALKGTVIALMLGASAFVYGVLLQGYYYAEKFIIPAVSIQLLVNITAICILVTYTYKALQQIVLKKIKGLIISIALITLANHLWNMSLSIALMNGKDLIVSMPNADMTPVMLLLVSLLVLALLSSEDFSALFAQAKNESQEESNAAESAKLPTKTKLNIIAVEHMLTEREREVMTCAYNGMTNPQIASQLNISLNTVKRHMHNVFEKIDVDSRIELIHMVNGWEDKR